MKQMNKAITIVLLNISSFFVILKTFANRPGDFGEESLSDQDLLYFILTTASTAGYGDITPKSKRAKMVVALLLFTLLIELYAFIMQKINN